MNDRDNPKGFAKVGGERPSCAESWKHPQTSQYSSSSAGTRTRSETLAPRALDKGDVRHAGTRRSHIVGHREK
jgi:hypothetical protein